MIFAEAICTCKTINSFLLHLFVFQQSSKVYTHSFLGRKKKKERKEKRIRVPCLNIISLPGKFWLIQNCKKLYREKQNKLRLNCYIIHKIRASTHFMTLSNFLHQISKPNITKNKYKPPHRL